MYPLVSGSSSSCSMTAGLGASFSLDGGTCVPCWVKMIMDKYWCTCVFTVFFATKSDQHEGKESSNVEFEIT